jgi:hypothetical protein
MALLAACPHDVLTTHHLLQLALSSLNPPSRISPGAAIGLLSAAVGNARDREDRRIVHYTRRLFEFDGTTSWQAAAAQMNALVACAIVLSAYLEFSAAHAVLDRAQELTALAAWAPGRDRAVEISEWRYQIELMRSGVHRRHAEMHLGSPHKLGAAVGAERAGHALAAATACTERAGKMLATMPGYRHDRYQSDAGDADAHYYTRLMSRSVEISPSRSHAAMVKPPPPICGSSSAWAGRHTAACCPYICYLQAGLTSCQVASERRPNLQCRLSETHRGRKPKFPMWSAAASFSAAESLRTTSPSTLLRRSLRAPSMDDIRIYRL